MVTSERRAGGAKGPTLRPLTRAEQRELIARLRDLSVSARVHQRYRLIEELRGGREVRDAADRAGCSRAMAYELIHRFNESGFSCFDGSRARSVEPLLPPATE
jgi:hypothetical protein